MVKVNNKDTFIVNFEQVNADWVRFLTTTHFVVRHLLKVRLLLEEIRYAVVREILVITTGNCYLTIFAHYMWLLMLYCKLSRLFVNLFYLAFVPGNHLENFDTLVERIIYDFDADCTHTY